MEIVTERLVLRRIRQSDAAVLHEIFRDEETMRYWSTLPHASLDQTREFIARTIAACDDGTGDDFAVTKNGIVVGKAGLWGGNEIGFIFSRTVWGAGVAHEAVSAVLARASAQGIASIRADVDPRNARSLALLKRLGFQEVGRAERTYRLGDLWADSVYLERLT
jgi:[ribosomal protein S5]-alanine N-acetyltransferase